MICLDSDIIIDFLKGKEKAVQLLKRYNNEIITTEINAFEVIFGVFIQGKLNEEERTNVSNFFNSLHVLAFDQGCGKISAQLMTSLIKKGLMVDQNDCLIASIMIKNNCSKILTNNKKHFSRIKNIEVVSD
ncbi:MAG TPA: type II toxin-antitoxin system VapC family toxin [Candidatus Nanoarchaeia archaeon]|nr:type II toxin-antitoxin system VapC family toxin [Candidatus Nanoarchaeia archaeon]